MAFVVSNSVNDPRAFSIGPVKLQLLNFTAASGDVAGTATADALSRVDYAVLVGLNLTAQPTSAGNVITFAFTDPAAARAGKILVFGK